MGIVYRTVCREDPEAARLKFDHAAIGEQISVTVIGKTPTVYGGRRTAIRGSAPKPSVNHLGTTSLVCDPADKTFPVVLHHFGIIANQIRTIGSIPIRVFDVLPQYIRGVGRYPIPSVAVLLLVVVPVSFESVGRFGQGSDFHCGELSVILPRCGIADGNTYASRPLGVYSPRRREVLISQSTYLLAVSASSDQNDGDSRICDIDAPNFTHYIFLG